MHVLNVNMILDPVKGGGTAERTFQLSRHLVENKTSCTVLSTDLGWTQARAQEFEGIETILLPCLWKRYYLPWPALGRIREAVARADIVHLMGHWTLLNAMVYFFVRRLNKQYVVCPAGALPIFGRSPILKRIYNFVVGKRIVRNASRCIAITNLEIDHFRAYGVKGDRVLVIPNGIDPEGLKVHDGRDLRERFGLGSNPYILFVGRLNIIKGPDLLIRAFAELDSKYVRHHLVMAGSDDGMQSELRSMIEGYGLQLRVHLIGHINGSDKACIYHGAELVVVPSRQEAMSIVVLEAGAAGKPVVITDRCGFDEVRQIGGGWVVSPTVDHLSKTLGMILEDTEALSAKGQALQKMVKERFQWTSVVNQYLTIFQQTLTHNHLLDGGI